MKDGKYVEGPNELPGSLSGFQKFLRYWLPALIYITLIFSFSSIPKLPIPAKIPHIDKVLHFLEYFVFGLILGRGVMNSFTLRGSLAACSVAVGLGALTGAGDEYFQRSVPGKVSSVYDFTADVVGLVVAQLVLIKVRAMWHKRKGTEMSRLA
ncbi:MAG: VanZ family protein [Candidatus Eisenbacteria bacterium]|nr:VanZ family protein [Candidatus Eisenbacteria bacterium]